MCRRYHSNPGVVGARYGVRAETVRTAPAPALIASPTASPDSLRRGESAVIGLEVVRGDGSPSDIDDSAILSLSLSSTALGELYLDGQPRGGTLDSIAVVDLIGERVRFVAHDAAGPGGTARVSATVAFDGETGSGFVDVPVVPDELAVTAEPEAVAYGEQARLRVEGRSFRGEPVELDPQTLVTLELSTGRYGSLHRESDSLGRGAHPRPESAGKPGKGASAARDIRLVDVPLAEFEADPVWFRVAGESPPADTAVTVAATSEHHEGDGELTVRGGALDHLVVLFETPGGARSDTLRHGEQYAHVVVEGRTADDVPLWLDPTLTIALGLSPAVEPFEDAYSAFYDEMSGRPQHSFEREVTTPSRLRGAPSVLRVEALQNPVGEGPVPFTVTASVVDSASVGLAERAGHVVEDYYLNLVAEPNRLQPGARAALRLEAVSKRSLTDTLALPGELAFDLSLGGHLFQPGGFEVGEGAAPVVSVAGVTAGQFSAGEVWYRAPAGVPEDSTRSDTTEVVVDGVELVAARSGDGFLRGEAAVQILAPRCELDWVHYTQGDSRWGSDRYGLGRAATIRGSGCALTTFAMAATALGGAITPGELNSAMKDRLGFQENLVQWGSAAAIVEDSTGVRVSTTRSGTWMYGEIEGGEEILNVADRTPDHVLDSHVSTCKPISVQVYNHNSTRDRREHWVMVVGKEDGRYRIFDPAGAHGYLDEYGGENFGGWFWGYTSYEHQP